jgi:hypothetical protein
VVVLESLVIVGAAQAGPPLPTSASAFALPIVMPAADSTARARPSAPAGTSALGADKFQHASLAAVIGIGAGALTRSSAAAFATPMALGLAKELAIGATPDSTPPISPPMPSGRWWPRRSPRRCCASAPPDSGQWRLAAG